MTRFMGLDIFSDRLSVDFAYVLLGMIQSDIIEGRFGWYRQLSGGNYYVSVRQILEAEKKIRFKSLIKFSNMTVTEVQLVMSDQELSKAVIILTDWQPADLESITTAGESNALYYVAGYAARSLNKKIKCPSCRVFLSISDTAIETGIT